jgi:hypothetical protein
VGYINAEAITAPMVIAAQAMPGASQQTPPKGYSEPKVLLVRKPGRIIWDPPVLVFTKKKRHPAPVIHEEEAQDSSKA